MAAEKCQNIEEPGPLRGRVFSWGKGGEAFLTGSTKAQS